MGSCMETVSYTHLDVYKRQVGDIRIVQNGWQRKHAKSIQYAYQKALYFRDYSAELESILVGQSFGTLSALNFDCLLYTSRCV